MKLAISDLTAMIGRLATDYDTLKALALALIGLIFLFLGRPLSGRL